MLRLVLIAFLCLNASSAGAVLPGSMARPEIVLRAAVGDGPGAIGYPREAGFGFPSEGPSALAVDEKDRVFVMDMIHGRILGFDSDGRHRLTRSLPGNLGDYFPDFLVRSGRFTLLNQTERMLYVLDADGRQRVRQPLAGILALPVRLGLSAEGELYIQDDEQRIVTVRPSGISRPVIQDGAASPFADNEGRLLVFGEEDSRGIEILSFAGGDGGILRRFGQLPRMRPDCTLMEYSVIGVDARSHIYLRLIEKQSPAADEEEVEIFYFRFRPDGRISGLLRTRPLPRIRCFPEREECVSPAGAIYLMASDEAYREFRVIRYRFPD